MARADHKREEGGLNQGEVLCACVDQTDICPNKYPPQGPNDIVNVQSITAALLYFHFVAAFLLSIHPTFILLLSKIHTAVCSNIKVLVVRVQFFPVYGDKQISL